MRAAPLLCLLAGLAHGRPQNEAPAVVSAEAPAEHCVRESSTDINDWYRDIPRQAEDADCSFLCFNDRAEWCMAYEFSAEENGTCKLFDDCSLRAADEPSVNVPWTAEQPSVNVPMKGPSVSVKNWLPPDHIYCHSKEQCDLDLPEPKLGGAFAVAANRSMHLSKINGCERVVYTVSLDLKRSAKQTIAELSEPPPGAEGCAFVFVHESPDHSIILGGPHQNSRPQWIPIEVPLVGLPWIAKKTRRNSRVPKLLPHLFFPGSVDTTVYIDGENSITYDIRAVVTTMLTNCGASFAAQAHATRFTDVMQEFEVVRYAGNSAEPENLDKQEQAYRADKSYMAAVDSESAVGIDAELLVRRNSNPQSQYLNTAWMRAYLRGSDRDQPAFSYALEKSALAACRARIGKAKYGEARCGLACGQGVINFVGSSRSADCLGRGVTSYCEGQPKGYCAVKPRPAWATRPPPWVCKGHLALSGATHALKVTPGSDQPMTQAQASRTYGSF